MTANDHVQLRVDGQGVEASRFRGLRAARRETAHQQLEYELEAAVGFADYCRFLGGAGVNDRVEEFVTLAQALFEETVSTVSGQGETRRVAGAS